jgi:SAM-dependent methyltransferase
LASKSSNEDFARLFDAQYADYDQDLPLWSALAQQCGSPILELGCGTGRVLLSLARSGYEIFGLDSNPAMLDLAAAKVDPDLAGLITLRRDDLREFSLPQRFRLAIAPLNVLAELDPEDFMSALAAIRQHLQPGGMLAMDLPNPAQSLLDPDDEDEPLDCFIDPESGHSIQVSARQRLLGEGTTVEVDWFYDELLPDGIVSRHQVETTYHLRDHETLRRLLFKSGFDDVSLYGDYELGAFADSSTRMIATASCQ